MRLHESVSSREVNQNSGRVFRVVRAEHAVVPVTYGSEPVPVAYIVPAEALQSREGALEAVALVTGRAMTKSGRSLRESFRPVDAGGRAASTLQELRDGDRY